MIAYIRGRIVEKNPALIVLETKGGVAYNINISLATFSRIKDDEDEVILYTHFVVKEDAQLLYGFYNQEERAVFRLLITVNGIGANTARLILSSLSISELQYAISTENVTAIKGVKGIGLKTAQRIIIDLKDKVNKNIYSEGDKISDLCNNNKFEALSALLSLGFSKNVAESALDKVVKASGDNVSVEDLIKSSLKII